jgi:hypothetical protein
MKEFIDAFGRNGTFKSICDDNLAPALDVIAGKIRDIVSTRCVGSVLRDVDPSREGVQPSCSVVEQVPGPGGTMIERPLPSCEAGGDPCWRIRSNGRDCPISGVEIEIQRGSAAAAKDSYAAVRCLVCSDDDPGCR